MQMRVLAVERQSAEEIQALDAARIIAALSEILSEELHLGRLALRAISAEGEAEKALLYVDRSIDREAYNTAKSEYINAKKLTTCIEHRLRTLNRITAKLNKALDAEKKY